MKATVPVSDAVIQEGENQENYLAVRQASKDFRCSKPASIGCTTIHKAYAKLYLIETNSKQKTQATYNY